MSDPSSKPAPQLSCPHCKGNRVEETQPGWISNMLFFLAILFVMSQINKGNLYKCKDCGKTFRSEA